MDLNNFQIILLWSSVILIPAVLFLLFIDGCQRTVEKGFDKATKYLEKQHERVDAGLKPEKSYFLFSPLMTFFTYLFLAFVVLLGAAVFVILPIGGATIVGIAVSLFIWLKKYTTALKQNMHLGQLLSPDHKELVQEVQKHLQKNLYGGTN
jgi:hypothetical protein